MTEVSSICMALEGHAGAQEGCWHRKRVRWLRETQRDSFHSLVHSKSRNKELEPGLPHEWQEQFNKSLSPPPRARMGRKQGSGQSAGQMASEGCHCGTAG